jgi:hypothetical protein
VRHGATVTLATASRAETDAATDAVMPEAADAAGRIRADGASKATYRFGLMRFTVGK